MASAIEQCDSPLPSLAPEPDQPDDPSCRSIIADSDMASSSRNSSMAISKPICFIADQTPTPTRFIRNCEEVGLFQDLQNVNPFDEQFRRATEAVTSGVTNSTVNRSGIDTLNGHQHHPDDALHTPHVFPPLTAEPVRPLLFQRSISVDEHGLLRPNFLVPSLSVSDGNAFSVPQVPSSTSAAEESSARSVSTISFAGSDTQGSKNNSTIKKPNRKRSDPGPVALSRNVNANNKRLFTSRIRNLLPSNSTLPGPPVLAPTSAKKTDTGVQLLLRLPDGKLLQIPALPLAPEMTAVASVAKNGVETVIAKTPEPKTIQSLKTLDTRQKLKEVLARGMGGTEARKVIVTAPAKVPVFPEANNNSSSPSFGTSRRADSESDGSQTSKYDSDPNQSSGSQKASLKRTRRGSEDDTPEDKRRKFLERNREAAYRSRQKRKDWIRTLETVAGELSATNKRLVAEVATLKTEVAQLKVLLLAHKDCPVTKAIQQGLITVNPISLDSSETETFSAIQQKSLPTTSLSIDPHPQPDRQIIILNAGNSTPNSNPVAPPVIIFKPFVPANHDHTSHVTGTQPPLKSVVGDGSKEIDGSELSLPLEIDLEEGEQNVSFAGTAVTNSSRSVIISPRTK